MNRSKLTTAVIAVALSALLSSAVVLAAKRIEFGPTTTSRPPEEAPARAEQPKGPEEPWTVLLLGRAAEKAGLPLVGGIFSATAETLAPQPGLPSPAQPSSGEAAPGEPPGGAREAGATPEGSPAPPEAKPVMLPDWATSQPLADYRLTSLAGAALSHPKGQTLRVLLCDFATSEEAWGFWSVGRGEKAIYVGQAASFGPQLRVWRGQFAAVLSLEPADPRLNEFRLTAFARTLFGLVPGTGQRPEMAAWLPTTNQLAHTLTYFHSGGPLGPAAMALSADTEGVSAQYEIGRSSTRAFEQRYGAPMPRPPVTGAVTPPRPVTQATAIVRCAVVRYPTPEAALKAWDAFVAQQVRQDPTSGTRGGRRVAPTGGGWSGIQLRGSVCAFVLDAPSRNQVQILLLQALSRAHDTASATQPGGQ